MRTIGNLLGGDPYTVNVTMDEIYNLEEKLAKVGYTAVLIRRAEGVGSWSRNPASFSRETLIPNFCHRRPNIVFFPSPHPHPNFGESRFLGSSQSPYPVKVRFPNSELYFGEIPDPGNTLPDPVLMSKLVTMVTKANQSVFNVTVLSIECQNPCLKL